MSNFEKPTKGVFDVVEGLTEVDEQTVEDFRRAMTDEVIPEIEEVIEERRALAAQTRRKQLKP
jgi:hypothetical protein